MLYRIPYGKQPISQNVYVDRRRAYEIPLERESNSPFLLRPLRKPAWQQLWVLRTPTRMNSDGLQLEAICTYYLPLVVYRLKSLYTFCLDTLLLPYLLVLMVFFPNKILNYLKKNLGWSKTYSKSPRMLCTWSCYPLYVEKLQSVSYFLVCVNRICLPVMHSIGNGSN